MPLLAGPELSVAATKSYIAALSADRAAGGALERRCGAAARRWRRCPICWSEAWALDWSAALAPLQGAQSLYVLGRGVGFGVAEEAALKLKETCGLHAEAFSAAEVRHGPMALVGPGFPVLAFAQGDETARGRRGGGRGRGGAGRAGDQGRRRARRRASLRCRPRRPARSWSRSPMR